jgi:8-oxo-dGTP pyrophosphatase MutT (NUDIX family)
MSTNDSLYRGLVSIKGVVYRDGLVALARNHRGEWDLPGGKRENGESFYDCLRREFDEELGLRVTWGRVLDAFPHHYYDDIVVIVIGCNASSSSPLRASEEHSEVRWFGVGDLGSLSIPPNYRSAIEQWVQSNGVLPTITGS